MSVYTALERSPHSYITGKYVACAAAVLDYTVCTRARSYGKLDARWDVYRSTYEFSKYVQNEKRALHAHALRFASPAILTSRKNNSALYTRNEASLKRLQQHSYLHYKRHGSSSTLQS